MSDATTTTPVETLPDGVFYRGARLWVSYYAPAANGRMKQEREPATRPDGSPARTVKDAVRFRTARLADVAMHRRGVRQFQGPRTERRLLSELLDEYERHAAVHHLKSLPQLRSRMKRLRAAFAGYRALAVTPDGLLAYVQTRQQDGAANATINRELEVVSRAFTLAAESGTLAYALKVPSLREDNARSGFFERANFQAVLTHLKEDDVRDFVEWFFWTGMRPEEIRSLTWADFDRETWTVRLHARDAKTGHGRALALVDDLRAVMERRLRARRLDCPLIFHRAGRPMGEFRKAWATACRAAGLATTEVRNGRTLIRPAHHVYDLRRTAARNMRRAGVHETTIMAITGHRTRSMLDRYNIVDEQDLRDAVVRTTAYVSTLPAAPTVIPLHPVEAIRP
jgi:integrase